MKPRLPVVRVLDASTYTKIAGDLRKNLPRKVIIDVERARDEDGKKIVLLRCRQPEAAKMAIADVLGEEYAIPEVEDELPPKRKEWWQRSVDAGMGGHHRDSAELRSDMDSYAKQFQQDILRVRRRMEGPEKGY